MFLNFDKGIYNLEHKEGMEGISQIKLSDREEFSIACTINNIKAIDLLQYFVDHVSFYVFIGGNTTAAYLWATQVCIECREALGARVEVIQDQRVQQVALKFIKKLTALIHDTDHIEGAAKSNSLMKMWEQEMLPLTTSYIQEIELSNIGKLYLSFDFTLLCNMNGISIQNQLQYFIDHLSLATERAVNFLEIVKTNPSNAVLLSLISSEEVVKNRTLPKQAIYRKYGLQLLKLDKKQMKENNLENRIANYRAFYLDWYHALNEEK